MKFMTKVFDAYFMGRKVPLLGAYELRYHRSKMDARVRKVQTTSVMQTVVIKLARKSRPKLHVV